MTSPRHRHRRSAWSRACVAATLVLLAGCASTRMDAEWSDPQFKGRSLKGARVMVICDAAELSVQRTCQDHLAAQLTALGATPLQPPSGGPGGLAPGVADRGVGVARAAGATAVLNATVAADMSRVDSGPSFSFGLGGFGGGGRTGVGVGVGGAVPVGGGSNVSTGYTASSVLTDVASGKLMWTGRASTAPSRDLGPQIEELARATAQAVREAGLF